MATATALTGAIMGHDEVAAVLARIATTGDELRRAFTDTTTADQDTLCCQTTADFNACFWDGEREDADQEHAFPRVGPPNSDALETEAAIPAGATFTAWSVPGIPWGIRAAFAIQCAHRAHQAKGLSDETGHSTTESFHPWHVLHPRAATFAAPFRKSTFEAA